VMPRLVSLCAQPVHRLNVVSIVAMVEDRANVIETRRRSRVGRLRASDHHVRA
jgi:hypothetical protein